MTKLVLPNVRYKKSFLEDYLKHDEMQEPYEMTEIPKTEVPKKFQEFIKRLNSQSKSKHLKPGYVPQTTYWLVDGIDFIGKAGVRHYLNPFFRKIGGHIGYYIRPFQRKKGYGKIILKLALKKAKSLGINKVLVTCDETNIGSKKIIESNGGKFASKTKMGKGLPSKLRYWIKI